MRFVVTDDGPNVATLGTQDGSPYPVRAIDSSLLVFTANAWTGPWANQNVKIDPVNGNDANDGVAQPLQTIAQVWLRLRNASLLGALTITFLSAPLATDVSAPLLVDLNGFNVTIVGGRTLQRNGAFNAGVAVQNPAAAGGGAATVLSDGGVASWAANVGQLCRVTAGADANNCAWVMKDTTGGTARGSVTRALAAPGTTAAASTIANGDAYAIETPWALNFGTHFFVNSKGSFCSVTYQDFDRRSASGVVQRVGAMCPGGCTFVLQRCRTVLVGGTSFSNEGGVSFQIQQSCYVSTGSSQLHDTSGDAALPAVYTGCAFIGTLAFSGGYYILQGDCYAQASAGQAGFGASSPQTNLQLGGSSGLAGGLAVFDGAVAGNVVTGRGATISLFGLVWGQTATAGIPGWRNVGPPPVSIVTTIPSVTGPAGDFELGGSAITTFRVWNEAGGAYTAAIANTWANVAAAVYHAAFDVQSGAGFTSTG